MNYLWTVADTVLTHSKRRGVALGLWILTWLDPSGSGLISHSYTIIQWGRTLGLRQWCVAVGIHRTSCLYQFAKWNDGLLPTVCYWPPDSTVSYRDAPWQETYIIVVTLECYGIQHYLIFELNLIGASRVRWVVHGVGFSNQRSVKYNIVSTGFLKSGSQVGGWRPIQLKLNATPPLLRLNTRASIGLGGVYFF